MNRLACIGWVILLAVLMTACQFPGTKIKPGDKIGDMEFISEFEECQAPNILNDICTFDALNDGTCEVPASLTKFWVSTGWSEGSQESLELSWKDSEWSMTFDDYEVNLYAFGTYDMDWEDMRARVWDVCVSNPTPGKHTVRYEFLLKNGVQRGNHEVIFNFTVLAAETP